MDKDLLDAVIRFMTQPDETMIVQLTSELDSVESEIAENETRIWFYTKQLDGCKAKQEKIMKILAQIDEQKVR